MAARERAVDGYHDLYRIPAIASCWVERVSYHSNRMFVETHTQILSLQISGLLQIYGIMHAPS